MLLMDTHVLIWLVEDDKRLHINASDEIQRSVEQQRLFVSAATYGELALLTTSGAIDVGTDLHVWRNRRLDNGIREIPLDSEMFILSERLIEQGGPPDPYDRRIMATAMVNRLQLATADARILAWDGPLDRLDVTTR